MILPNPAVLTMPIYSAPEEGRLEYLRLDFNENTRGPSPKVLEALYALKAEEYGCYPEYEELLSAISNYLRIDRNYILPTNGSDEAIKSIFQTYIQRGDEVILFSPSYAIYEIYAALAEAKQVVISLEEKSGYAYPVEVILNAIKPETRLIAIVNPNNPTGSWLDRQDLIKILEKNPKTIVVLDECYAPFAKSSDVDLVAKYPNLMITQTFSKSFGLAGLRVGYVVSHPENIGYLKRVILPTFSLSRIAAVAAMAALKDKAYLDSYVEEVLVGRQLLIEKMNQMGFKPYPSRGNFVLVNFGDQLESIKARLKKNKILVREKKEGLRISIGTLEQTQRLIKAIEDKKPAIIFDMDGVLVDESQSYRACIKKTLEDLLGTPIDGSIIEQAKQAGGCNDDYDCIAKILSDCGLEIDRQEIMKRFDCYYESYKYHEKWLIDESILQSLKVTASLGIYTGRPKRDALDALKRFQKTHLFDVVVTRDDVKNGKPDPEGLYLACNALNADQAIYLGDNLDDALAAQRAGCSFIPIASDTTSQWIVQRIIGILNGNKRETIRKRVTKETGIHLMLNIDGSGRSSISTKIGFFDHMLNAFAKHGDFNLDVVCNGDLHIDQHHTVEDIGIALGEAFTEVLKDKRGIARSGYFAFPMDESLAICSLDFSNRPCLEYNVPLAENKCGDFETVNLPNFFSGFVKGAQVNLHIQVPYGADPHHKMEAIFKAFGKALKMATRIEEKRALEIPSTKGML